MIDVILCGLDVIVGVLERENGVGVQEVGEVLVGLRPCPFVLPDLWQFVDVSLTQACAQERPQCR